MDDRWHHMDNAPKDGTRILVTIGAAEQGPAEVDVVFWASADEHSVEGWRAADSHSGNVVGYADPELKCWMPLPKAGQSSVALESDMPAPWGGDDAQELFGSGI